VVHANISHFTYHTTRMTAALEETLSYQRQLFFELAQPADLEQESVVSQNEVSGSCGQQVSFRLVPAPSLIPINAMEAAFDYSPVNCIVDDFLYQGNRQAATDIQWLEESQINAIVNVTCSLPCFYSNQMFDYCVIRVDDVVSASPVLRAMLPRAVHFIGLLFWTNQ
jgi:hypothetical protein